MNALKSVARTQRVKQIVSYSFLDFQSFKNTPQRTQNNNLRVLFVADAEAIFKTPDQLIIYKFPSYMTARQ